MNESAILTERVTYPESNLTEFRELVRRLVGGFPANRLCRKVDAGDVTPDDYHAFLNMIFHQTFEGPSTFAMAGAHCDVRLYRIRDYLIEHAEEERAHWQWVIEDLRGTGFRGPDPRSVFPRPECQNYLAFNVYCAIRMPPARLATAAFLEGVGASYGKKYAQKLCDALKLKPEQVKFVFGHGDTDVGHSADILGVLDASPLAPHDWARLGHAVRTAASLYRAMYDAVVS
jgi:hypothetical protein